MALAAQRQIRAVIAEPSICDVRLEPQAARHPHIEIASHRLEIALLGNVAAIRLHHLLSRSYLSTCYES